MIAKQFYTIVYDALSLLSYNFEFIGSPEFFSFFFNLLSEMLVKMASLLAKKVLVLKKIATC